MDYISVPPKPCVFFGHGSNLNLDKFERIQTNFLEKTLTRIQTKNMSSTKGLYVQHSNTRHGVCIRVLHTGPIFGVFTHAPYLSPDFYQANGYWMLPALFLVFCLCVVIIIRIWIYAYEYYMKILHLRYMKILQSRKHSVCSMQSSSYVHPITINNTYFKESNYQGINK